MSSVILVLLYRHPLADNVPTQNIPKIEKIYRQRFSNIHHLVPFYQGEQSNVSPIYVGPKRVHVSLAISLRRFFCSSYQHYLFAWEDTLLNPRIDENNYAEHFNLDRNTSFIPDISVDDKNLIRELEHLEPAFVNNRTRKILKLDSVDAMKKWQDSLTISRTHLFVVDQSSIEEFAHVCGYFSLRQRPKRFLSLLSLEVPTALVFSAQKLITEKDLQLKSKHVSKSKYQRYAQLKVTEQMQCFPKDTLCLYIKQ